jgi:hypothetical protein
MDHHTASIRGGRGALLHLLEMDRLVLWPAAKTK